MNSLIIYNSSEDNELLRNSYSYKNICIVDTGGHFYLWQDKNKHINFCNLLAGLRKFHILVPENYVKKNSFILEQTINLVMLLDKC